MLPHYTVRTGLSAPLDLTTPPEGGTYITLFAHHISLGVLEELATSKARTFRGFLKEVAHFNKIDGYSLWKGGEVEGGNTYLHRLDTLSSMVNTGRKDVPTAQKMHQRVIKYEGFVYVLMIPVFNFSSERLMMAHLCSQYSIEFDNFGPTDRVRGRPTKKMKLPHRPFLFTV